MSRRDAAAFRILYGRHTAALFAMAMRIGGNAADAEDAVHDAWIRAVEAMPRFEWRSSLRTWLTGILLNRLRELERHRTPTVALDDALLSSAVPVELPHGVDPIDLDAAIAELPPGYRRILVLHDIEGFTHEDIGTMLGIDPGTSKSQLSRARRHLRRALSIDDQENP
jgi:RNA polymerase sigma-70 factor (ECF subfamily)